MQFTYYGQKGDVCTDLNSVWSQPYISFFHNGTSLHGHTFPHVLSGGKDSEPHSHIHCTCISFHCESTYALSDWITERTLCDKQDICFLWHLLLFPFDISVWFVYHAWKWQYDQKQFHCLFLLCLEAKDFFMRALLDPEVLHSVHHVILLQGLGHAWHSDPMVSVMQYHFCSFDFWTLSVGSLLSMILSHQPCWQYNWPTVTACPIHFETSLEQAGILDHAHLGSTVQRKHIYKDLQGHGGVCACLHQVSRFWYESHSAYQPAVLARQT